jgi:MerR family transcriptional regulator, light-induced transcriptional regulator
VTRTDAAAAGTPGSAAAVAGLSVTQAAQRVGVAGSTLRTWERRYGVSPSGRTAGGHRRYTLDDITSLQRLRRLVDSGMSTASAAGRFQDVPSRPSARAEGGRPIGVSRLAGRLSDAIATMNSSEAARQAARIVARLGVVDAWVDVFVPQLQFVGDQWERTGEGVEREHLAAAAIRSALLRHGTRRPGREPSTRVLALASPGEGHTLPLDALAAAANEVGVGVCVLESLPSGALHAAVDDVSPAVVVLWARSRETSDLRLLRTLLKRVPVVFAAGPGWPVRRLPAAIIHVDDLPGALAAVRAWIR